MWEVQDGAGAGGLGGRSPAGLLSDEDGAAAATPRAPAGALRCARHCVPRLL